MQGRCRHTGMDGSKKWIKKKVQDVRISINKNWDTLDNYIPSQGLGSMEQSKSRTLPTYSDALRDDGDTF